MSTREFKATDLQLPASGNVQFTEFQDSENGTTTAKVSLVCRTDSAVAMWWGMLIHELSGVFHKDKVPLDWRHNSDELVGYLDQFKVSNEKIECSGMVISTNPKDRAALIMKQANAGVPFESSIFFGGQGLEVEEVPAEKEVTVNGRTFSGPGLVFRKWPLRGVALCPYGADNQTSVNLALKGDAEKFSAVVLLNKEENTMSEVNKTEEEIALEKATVEAEALSQKKKEDELAEKGVTTFHVEFEENEAVTKPTSPDGLPGQDFIDSFGSDGAVWFAEGKTFPQAQVLHSKKLEERVKELEGRLSALKKNASGDEELDANFVDEGESKQLSRRIRDTKLSKETGTSRFASSITLPQNQK